MRKSLTNTMAIIGLTLCVNTAARAQYFLLQITQKEAKAYQFKLAKTTDEKLKADLLFRLAHYHIFKPLELKKDLDSAASILVRMEALARDINFRPALVNAKILRAIIDFERKDHISGYSKIKAAALEAQQYGLNDQQGWIAYELAVKYPGNDQIDQFKASLKFYRAARNRHKVADLLFLIGNENYGKGREKEAIEPLLESQKLYEQIKFENLVRLYSLLSLIYTNMSNRTESLKYGLLAIESAEKVRDTVSVSVAYANVGTVYRSMRDYKNALAYYKKAQPIFEQKKSLGWIYHNALNMSYCYLALDSGQKAISNYVHYTQKFPPENLDRKFLRDQAMVNLYTRMNYFIQADAYRVEMDSYLRDNPSKKTPGISRTFGDFYFQFRDYPKAREYYQVAARSSSSARESFARLASIDSVMGNFQSALGHYQSFKYLSDSLNNVNRIKVIEQLQLQFEVKKKEANLALKDAELQLKDRNIVLLNQNAILLTQRAEILNNEARLRQAKLVQSELMGKKNEADLRLKDQNIKLRDENIKFLSQQSSVQQAQLRQQKTIRNYIIALVGLCAIIIGLVVRQYHLKKRAAAMIGGKNEMLQQLLADKGWLLKEMHHRVKNNLQTIISLLESQCAYLESNALDAIKNSQNRVFAMSLIHQKLYQAEEITTIDMSIFVPELVQNLRDSFGIGNNISISIAIDKLGFEIEQAVPLALIINEAVTNAMKYAFPNQVNGQISISLKTDEKGDYSMIIADNGIGLGEDFGITDISSLGIKLIRGLSRQLEADLQITGNDGTCVKVSKFSGFLFQAKVQAGTLRKTA